MNSIYSTNMSNIHHPFITDNKKLFDIFPIVTCFLFLFFSCFFRTFFVYFSCDGFRFEACFHSKSLIKFIFHGNWYRTVNRKDVNWLYDPIELYNNNKKKLEIYKFTQTWDCKKRYDETETLIVIFSMKIDHLLVKSLFDLWVTNCDFRSFLESYTNDKQSFRTMSI